MQVKKIIFYFTYQRKLESEIEEMEEKFSAKRKKIIDNSQNFKNKMEEVFFIFLLF